MRRDQWFLVVLIALFVLLMATLFFVEKLKVEEMSKSRESLDVYVDSDNDSDDVVSGDADSGASSGGSGDDVFVGSEDIEEVLPDVNERECGFYFESYGVCAGTCPSGECVSEGRSCYCKSSG